jgi:hypothetical protein
VETNYVTLHPWVRGNLDTFYVKTLDWYLLRSLQTEIAALIYPHLSCIFHSNHKNQDYIEIHYAWLAQRIGIKVRNDLREAKKQLKAAHQELIEKGYLADTQWHQDKIRYFPGLRASVEVARQRKRKRAIPLKGAKQLTIPTLESLKEVTDERANEIAYQAARLQTGRPLRLERLTTLKIDPQEIYTHITTLRKVQDGASSQPE